MPRLPKFPNEPDELLVPGFSIGTDKSSLFVRQFQESLAEFTHHKKK
jgi:hypothetical protein